MEHKEIVKLTIMSVSECADDYLLSAIGLMSQNLEQIKHTPLNLFDLIEEPPFFYISPVYLDFLDNPLQINYIFEWSQFKFNRLDNHLNNITDGVLFNLGQPIIRVVEAISQQQDKISQRLRMQLAHIKTMIQAVNSSNNIPICYALHDNHMKTDLALFQQILEIPSTKPLLTYSYFQPHTIKEVLRYSTQLVLLSKK